jgi:hypothetical protein
VIRNPQTQNTALLIVKSHEIYSFHLALKSYRPILCLSIHYSSVNQIQQLLPLSIPVIVSSLLGLCSAWLRTGRQRFDPRQRQRIFPLAPVSTPAVRPTKPPIQCVPGVLSPEVKRGRGVTLTTHPIYCRGQEWVWSIFPLPLVVCMAVAGQLYILRAPRGDRPTVSCKVVWTWIVTSPWRWKQNHISS